MSSAKSEASICPYSRPVRNWRKNRRAGRRGVKIQGYLQWPVCLGARLSPGWRSPYHAPTVARQHKEPVPDRIRHPDSRRRRARRGARPGGEDVFDVAHRQAARQKLHRQPFERLGAPLEALPDLRAEPILAPGNLRRRAPDEPFRCLQTTPAVSVTIALAGLRSMLVVLPTESVAALRLQRFLHDESCGDLHQVGSRIGTRQTAFDQIRKRLGVSA